jgi:PadR family transcriptional regulator PadR
MDTQRKKGVLEICVLAALQKEPSYGYRIVSDVTPYITVSESTLYPILRRLEGSGCVSTFSQEHNGRLRKYYRLEEPGREKIQAFLAETEEMRRIYQYIEEDSRK